MLKSINRLKKRKEFNYIYKKGEVFHSGSFNMFVTKTYYKVPTIGISVSKQVGNSVIRSRAKRIISEACRLNINHFAKKNYVFNAKESIVDKSSIDLEQEIIKVLKKAGLYIETTNV